MANQLDTSIDALAAAAKANTDAEESAIIVLNGIPALIQAAVDKAIAAGATTQELQAVQDVIDKITAETPRLASAVAANTGPASGKAPKH